MGRVRHSFAPTGRWRIAFINGITAPDSDQSEHFQQVFLRRAEADSRAANDLIARDVPFGETLDLWHGLVFNDGVADDLASASGFEEFSLAVNLRADAIRVVQRGQVDDNGQLVVPSSFSNSVLSIVGQAWFLLIPGANNTQIFIPCQEIFRFYYLISSRLGRTILRGDILQHDQFLYDSGETSGPDPDGRMTLAIRRGVLESDAPVIARWVASPKKVGLSRATNIALHFMTQHKAGTYVPIHALPPFDGVTTWHALGRKITLRGQNYLFICRLISCSAPFGFETLEWCYADERPRPTGEPPDDPPELKPTGALRKKPPNTLPFVYLEEDTERPGSKFVPDVFPIDSFSERFPSVDPNSVARKLPAEDNNSPNKPKNGIEPGLATALTSRPVASGGNNKVQTVDLTVAGDKSSDTEDEDESDQPAIALAHVLNLCTVLTREFSVRWRDAAVGPGLARLDDHTFDLLPTEIDGVRKRFLYLDERRTKRRPVYIAEFAQEQIFGYLLELVRKPSEKFSMVLLRSAQGPIPNKKLRAVLDQIAVSASVVLPLPFLHAFDLQSKRMTHRRDLPISYRVADLARYWSFIRKPSESPAASESE